MSHDKKHIIRQWVFEEVNKSIIVKKQYPNIQWDEFEYEYPFKEGGLKGWDKLGIMASTIYNDKLFYEYYVLLRDYYIYKNEIYIQLKDQIDKSILNYKTNYGKIK
jgi:hypothetical protein